MRKLGKLRLHVDSLGYASLGLDLSAAPGPLRVLFRKRSETITDCAPRRSPRADEARAGSPDARRDSVERARLRWRRPLAGSWHPRGSPSLRPTAHRSETLDRKHLPLPGPGLHRALRVRRERGPTRLPPLARPAEVPEQGRQAAAPA